MHDLAHTGAPGTMAGPGRIARTCRNNRDESPFRWSRPFLLVVMLAATLSGCATQAEQMDVGAASRTRAGEGPSATLTPEQKRQVLTAGGAAALDTIAEPGQDKPKGKKKN